MTQQARLDEPFAPLVERIRAEATVENERILKIDHFLNHRIEPQFMADMGRALADRLHPLAPDLLLTAEASGIASALATAFALDVPLVYAKKYAPVVELPALSRLVPSPTKGGMMRLVVAEQLEAHGHIVVAWNRSQVATDDPEIVRRFIRTTRPDWFLHIATGSADWTEWIAQVCAEDQIEFLFTSTVSVFSAQQHGPFGIDVQPAATDDYGAYKSDCEQRIRRANPQAIIARLAWQIGTAPGSNNMIDFLHRTMQANGQIEASTNWYPACAFLEDTADGVYRLIDAYEAGLYQLDGNPGLTFHQIVTKLNRLHGNPWTIVPTTTPVQNNRMLDDRITMKPITARLGN